MGSEYFPFQEASNSNSMPEYVPDWLERHRLRDTPLGSPTTQASDPISFESSEVLAENGDSTSSASLTASNPMRTPLLKKEGENPKSGLVGGAGGEY